MVRLSATIVIFSIACLGCKPAALQKRPASEQLRGSWKQVGGESAGTTFTLNTDGSIIVNFIRNEQPHAFSDRLLKDLNEKREVVFDLGGHAHDHREGRYILRLDPTAKATMNGNDVGAFSAQVGLHPEHPIEFRELREGRDPVIVRAAAAIVKTRSVTEPEKIHVTIVLKDCQQFVGSGSDEPILRAKYEQSFDFPMSEARKGITGNVVTAWRVGETFDVIEMTGNWKVDGENLVLSNLHAGPEHFAIQPTGSVETDKIISYDVDSFATRDQDGGTRSYARVK